MRRNQLRFLPETADDSRTLVADDRSQQRARAGYLERVAQVRNKGDDVRAREGQLRRSDRQEAVPESVNPVPVDVCHRACGAHFHVALDQRHSDHGPGLDIRVSRLCVSRAAASGDPLHRAQA